MGTRPFSFPKSHRLTSRTLIERVFQSGTVVKSFPFLVRILPLESVSDSSTQVLISVPKRTFKRAVDRNRIKRWMRESWRMERLPLEDALRSKNQKWAVVFIFVGKEMPDWNVCSAAMKKLIHRSMLLLNEPKNGEHA